MTRVFRMLLHRVLQSDGADGRSLSARSAAGAAAVARSLDGYAAFAFSARGFGLAAVKRFRSPAQFRLILEEFFWLECGLALKEAKARLASGIAFELNERVREKIKTDAPV